MEIKISDLSAAVMAGLKEYSATVAAEIKEAAKETASDCAKELRQTSPVRKSNKTRKDSKGEAIKKGRYTKGWKVKKAFENGVMARYTVYNATNYQLTHLLEKGHAKRGGGRVAAIPHIEPAEQKAIEEMEKRGKEACKQ